MNDSVKEALDRALNTMRAQPAFQQASPEDRAKLEKIVMATANGGVDQVVATLICVMVVPAMRERYKADAAVVQDFMNAGFNALKVAIIADTIMTIFPNEEAATPAAVEMLLECQPIYTRSIATLKNIGELLMDSRKERP